MKDKLCYQVALSLLPGIGSILAKQLVSYVGSVEGVFSESKAKLAKIPGIGPKTADLITSSDLIDKAESEIKRCEKQNVSIHFYTDDSYPYKLKQAVDCPLILYSKGNQGANFRRGLAIVGTRNATEYGKSITEQLVEGLKPYSCAVVSGLAYGIDIKAHKTAVERGIATFAVLGSGVDVIYPAVHKDTAINLQQNGALLSEYPLGTKPEAYHFPARNRIIAGMSDAVVVIEAAAKGGALITADIANSYNRDVFALPGNLDHQYSVGCNRLIQQQKAMIFTSVEDLVKELNWDVMSETELQEQQVALDSFSREEKLIVGLLTEERKGLQIDQLAWKSQLTVNQLASVLLSLEFNGVIKSLPGKKYQLRSRF